MAPGQDDGLELQQEPSPLAVLQSVGNRLYFHWGVGNEIFCSDLYNQTIPYDHRSERENESVSTSNCIRWGGQGPAQRRVAYDTCSKYLEYATELNIKSSSSKNSQALGKSSMAALEFAQSISDILGATTISSGNETDDVLQVVEEKALWDLLCCFVFDSSKIQRTHSTTDIPDISGWYYGNATAMCGMPSKAPWSDDMIKYLQKADVPELEDVYWAVFLRLVSLGWISDALDVLGLHSAWLQWDSASDDKTPADVSILENISSLLRRFPILNDNASSETSLTRRFDTMSDLFDYRKSWLDQCAQLQKDSHVWEECAMKAPETKNGCLACLNILLGDENTIHRFSHSWCEILISEITHKYPDLTSLSGMKQILMDVISKKPPENHFEIAVASIIEHGCEMDHQAIISSCSHLVSDWFLCHIPLILEMHPHGPGPLHTPLLHVGGDQAEFFMLDYACALASNSLTWQLASRYLGFCSNHGKEAFIATYRMLPLCVTGAMARQAVNLAQEYGLGELCGSIQKQQGALCWQNGLYGLAAYWYALAGDMCNMDICLGGLNSTETALNSKICENTINDLEECIDALHLSEAAHPGPNYTVLLTRICAFKKTRRCFERVTDVLRRVNENLRIHCMKLLVSSIPEITPGFLKEEDLILLLDYVNSMGSHSHEGTVTASRKRLIQLIALLDINAT